MPIAIVVHGGAWEIPDGLLDAHARGCRIASELGYEVLRGGGSALDAVERAVRSLEDDPTFDAGRGSFLTLDGLVELDAGIMDGDSMVSGAVAAVSGVPNPVTLARRILEAGHERLVVGTGASALAAELGVATCDPGDLETEFSRSFWERRRTSDPREIFAPAPRGTVGAVALDAEGRIAAATSTGGLPHKRPGRVGDSPLVGAGFYADSYLGGASATGYGEAIMTVGLSRLAVERLAAGDAALEAACAAVEALSAPRIEGRGGVIVLDREGRAGAAFSTSRMARSWIDASGSRVVAVDE